MNNTYKIEFSLCKWNFIVNFNDYEDYTFYLEQIKTSVNDMFLKDNDKQTITINYINSKQEYDKLSNILNKPKKKVQSFENEYYNKVDNYFISLDNKYIIESNNNEINMFCNSTLKRHELIYIIREIFVRLEENNNALFMHGNGITFENKGLIITGNSGSGKTTLMLKLFENNSNPTTFLSNDRIFITEDNKMNFFPIPIILANGTVKTNPQMFEFLKNKESLYDSNYNPSILYSKENNIKFALFRNYIPQIYTKTKLQESNQLDAIIIPKLSFNNDKPIITNVEDIQELHHMCFTPFDYESLRKPWIYKRNKSEIELFENSLNILKEKIKMGEVYKLVYNPDIPPDDIKETIYKKLIKKL